MQQRLEELVEHRALAAVQVDLPVDGIEDRDDFALLVQVDGNGMRKFRWFKCVVENSNCGLVVAAFNDDPDEIRKNMKEKRRSEIVDFGPTALMTDGSQPISIRSETLLVPTWSR